MPRWWLYRQTLPFCPGHQAPMNESALESLSADRPLRTVEAFEPNDFYGAATLLKRYAGLPETFIIPGTLPHGPSINRSIWETELKHPLPRVFCLSSEQRSTYEARCEKEIVPIGSPLYYAVKQMGDEALTLKEGASGTVAFPAHSTHHVTCNFDQREFIEALEAIPEEVGPVRVCLYWRDIQLGRHKAYQDAGFECVTAGHIFDPNFLSRMASIILSHRCAITNNLGSSVIYSAALGLTVRLVDQVTSNTAENEEFLNELAPKTAVGSALRLLESMQSDGWQSFPAQQESAEVAMGLEFIRSPDELRALFEQKRNRTHFPSPTAAAPRSWEEELRALDSIGDCGVIAPEGRLFQFDDRQRISAEWTAYQAVRPFLPEPSFARRFTLIDCGAGLGLFSRLLATKMELGEVYAFEANPYRHEILSRNLIGGMKVPIHCLRKAGWIETGRAQFQLRSPASSSHTDPIVDVETIRLADLLNELSVDLLRLNVGGAEGALLENCFECLWRAKHLIVEFGANSPSSGLADELDGKLRENGFEGNLISVPDGRRVLVAKQKEALLRASPFVDRIIKGAGIG